MLSGTLAPFAPSEIKNRTIELGFVRVPFDQKAFGFKRITSNLLPDSENDFFVALAAPEFFKNVPGPTISVEELMGNPLLVNHRYYYEFQDMFRRKNGAAEFICRSESYYICSTGPEKSLASLFYPTPPLN